jgi:hypothetical protein
VKGITSEAFIPESLIPPQGIPPLCDDPGLRSAVLSWLPTLNESGVVVRQTGDRDPHRGIRIPGLSAGGSQPADAGSRAGGGGGPGAPPPPPPAAPNSSDKGKGAAGSSSSPGATGRSEGERRHRLRRTDGSFVSDPPLDSDPPRSVRGWLARPWRPAPRPRARRGASVLLLHHHQTTATATIIRFAAATPRAAVAGTVNVPLSGSLEGPGPQVSVPLFYFFTGLVIISTGINPSSAYQGLLPLCSQSRSHW